jgi:molybdate transport system substrate-binding protein
MPYRATFAIVLAVLLLAAPALRAAELIVFSGGAVKSVLPALASEYTKKTGTKVTLAFSAMGPLKAKLTAKERADVAIATPAALDDLEKSGVLPAGERVPVARVGVGVAMKSGAAAPRIGTPEEFRQALLSAPVISYGDPNSATTGIYFAKLLREMGLEETVRGKTQLRPDGYQVIDFVSKGKGGELGIAPISEIRDSESKGVRLVGPLPGNLQTYNSYMAVILPGGRQEAEARAFAAHLIGAQARARFVAAGFEASP